MIVMKELISLTMFAMETGKTHSFSSHSTVAKRENASSKIQHFTTSKIYILRKRAQKLRNILFLHFMTTFHNFALKIETSWAEGMVKPISEFRWCIYIWFVCSQIKKIWTRYIIKKKNLNVQNLHEKTKIRDQIKD